MLPSKPRSGLSDTLNNKTIQATPKASKTNRGGSTKSDLGAHSPLQKARISPKSVELKSTISRSAKVNSDKHARAQAGENHGDLKKAKEQLASVEKEKERIIEELKDAKMLVDVYCKKEEEWAKGLESIKRKQSLEVDALNSVAQELEKARNELELTTKAKNAALSEAEDVKKIADSNGMKVGLLSAEVSRLKSLLNSKHGSVGVIEKLNSEIDALRFELERAKEGEERMVIMESLVEKLSAEVDNAKSSEVNSLKLVEEWKKKAEILEIQLMEAKKSEKSSMQDYKFEISALKEKVGLLEDQLAEKSSLETAFQDAESENAVLKGKVESLEIEVADVKKRESDMGKLVDEWKKKTETLQFQLLEAEKVKEQLEESHSSLNEVLTENSTLRIKIESLETEKVADLYANRFLEERAKLLEELEMAKREDEKVKKAMEALTLALHEVSVESRETQEKLLSKRVEHEDTNAQIEQLRLVLKNTRENYEVMLDEARYEIVCLKNAIEKYENEQNEPKLPNLEVNIEERGEEIEGNEVSEKVKVETLTLPSSDTETELDELSSSDEVQQEYVNDEYLTAKEVHGDEKQCLEEEETAEEGDKAIGNEEEFVDDELELKMENSSVDLTNGLVPETTENAVISHTKQLKKKKKKPLLQKFGNLLKKKNNH